MAISKSMPEYLADNDMIEAMFDFVLYFKV